MRQTAPHAGWFQEAADLITEHPDHLVAAQAAVLRLVTAARSLVESVSDTARLPEEELLLAVKLVEAAAPASVPGEPVSPVEARRRYQVLLTEASGAVSACRRVAHPGGRCWFSLNGPADDVCGRVLAAGHRLR